MKKLVGTTFQCLKSLDNSNQNGEPSFPQLTCYKRMWQKNVSKGSWLFSFIASYFLRQCSLQKIEVIPKKKKKSFVVLFRNDPCSQAKELDIFIVSN